MNESPEPHEPIDVSMPGANEELREALDTTTRQRDDLARLVREKQAEFENYQKRAARDREQERLYQYKPFANELLPVYDNLERAVNAAKQAGESGVLVTGVQATLHQFLEVLRRFGITRIETQGQPFDPNVHQAVSQMPNGNVPAGTVLHVLQQGFAMHEQVLRPAHVIVSVATDTN